MALLVPLASFAAQGTLPGISWDSALEVISQLESMNLIDSSYVTEGMRAVWSTGLAKKYPHLLWALLNEPFEVKAPRAAKVVLTGHVALRVLKPKVARRALKFIYNGTIQATPIHKLPLEGKPSSLAVDALYHTIKQASPIPQPAPSIAMLPPMMMMSVQTLLAVAQQPPAAVATNSPTVGANTFGEMLHPVNVDVSIIEASPCPSATAPRSWKISVLREIHPCGGLVLDFPIE